jgi:hypothetical protein
VISRLATIRADSVEGCHTEEGNVAIRDRKLPLIGRSTDDGRRAHAEFTSNIEDISKVRFKTNLYCVRRHNFPEHSFRNIPRIWSSSGQ